MGSGGRGEGERGKEKGKQPSISSLPSLYLVTFLPLPHPTFLFVFHQSDAMVNYFITDFLQLLLKGGDWAYMPSQDRVIKKVANPEYASSSLSALKTVSSRRSYLVLLLMKMALLLTEASFFYGFVINPSHTLETQQNCSPPSQRRLSITTVGNSAIPVNKMYQVCKYQFSHKIKFMNLLDRLLQFLGVSAL